MTGTLTGLSLLVLAGAMNASFTLPMKYTRRWSWENTWLAWTIFALLLLPPTIALATVPHLEAVYRSADVRIICEVAGFGAGWGVAQVFLGLAVDAIGIALTFSLVLGTSAAVGALVPLLRLHPESLNTAAGNGVLGGVALVIAGVLACAAAGRRRESALNVKAGNRKNATLGLLLAILCGFGASFINFGLTFGAPLVASARLFGASADRFQCCVDAVDDRWRAAESPLLFLASQEKPYCRQVSCRWRKSLGAGFRHGRLLVRKYSSLWSLYCNDGRVGSDPGLAIIHVAHCDRRQFAGNAQR
jgi:L-rhamnose-H+ transport protein